MKILIPKNSLTMVLFCLLFGCSVESLNPNGNLPNSALNISKPGVIRPMTAPCDPTPYITSITLVDANHNPVVCGNIHADSTYYIQVSGKVSSFCLTISSGATLIGATCRDNSFTSPYHYGDIGTKYFEVTASSTVTAITGYVTPIDACAGDEPNVNFNFPAPVYTSGTTITFTYNLGQVIITSNYPLGDNIPISGGSIKTYNTCGGAVVGTDGVGSVTMNACTTNYTSAAGNVCGQFYKYLFVNVNGTIFSSNGSTTINGHSYGVALTTTCSTYQSPGTCP